MHICSIWSEDVSVVWGDILPISYGFTSQHFSDSQYVGGRFPAAGFYSKFKYRPNLRAQPYEYVTSAGQTNRLLASFLYTSASPHQPDFSRAVIVTSLFYSL